MLDSHRDPCCGPQNEAKQHIAHRGKANKVGVEGIRTGKVLHTGTAWSICRMKLTNARRTRLLKTHAHTHEGTKGPMYPPARCCTYPPPQDVCRERPGGWLAPEPLRCASSTASPDNRRDHEETDAALTATPIVANAQRRSGKNDERETHAQIPEVGVQWRAVCSAPWADARNRTEGTDSSPRSRCGRAHGGHDRYAGGAGHKGPVKRALQWGTGRLLGSAGWSIRGTLQLSACRFGNRSWQGAPRTYSHAAASARHVF